MKDLAKRLNALEIGLHYNNAIGDHESIEAINDEIYKIRQQIKNRVKEVLSK